jgi:hypothetical protein
MDEIVIRAIARWPNVPSVYGWLRLDRRGNWLVKSRAERDGALLFERISNRAVIEFIGRNYEQDGAHRWYFQNGPQRVFVTLDYTPWVYRLDDAGAGFLTHAANAPRTLEAVFLDDSGSLLLKTELGIGVLLDRDLSAVLERLSDEGGRPIERLLEEVAQGAEAHVMLHGNTVPIASVRSADVPGRFGFVPRPMPRQGEREC